MSTKQTLSVTLPDGTTESRTTARPYTHVAVAQFSEDGRWGAVGWSASEKGATKRAEKAATWAGVLSARVVAI